MQQAHRDSCRRSSESVTELIRMDREGFRSEFLPPGVSLTELHTCLSKWRVIRDAILSVAVIHAIGPPDAGRGHAPRIARVSLGARIDHGGHPGRFFRVIEAEIDSEEVLEAFEVLCADMEEKLPGRLTGYVLQHPLLGVQFAPIEQEIIERNSRGFQDSQISSDWKARLIRGVELGKKLKRWDDF